MFHIVIIIIRGLNYARIIVPNLFVYFIYIEQMQENEGSTIYRIVLRGNKLFVSSNSMVIKWIDEATEGSQDNLRYRKEFTNIQSH